MNIERALERLVEGTFARIFGSQLQPIELSRRIAREMDLRRTIGVRGLVAPNAFSIAINAADYEKFETVSGKLANELCESAREHARTANYLFMGPVSVAITKDEGLGKGQFLVSANLVESDDEAVTGTVIMGDNTRIDVGEDPLVIGRVGECDIVLADSNASRRHAEIRREGMYFVVTDLGSTNGTKVNGANIRERRLQDGDQITIGTTSMTFRTA